MANCTADVRLQNIVVDKTAHQGNIAARAAIEVDTCADVILENVSVSSTIARAGYTSNPDGANNGLSAVRFADTEFLLRDCTLVGYDAPSGGSFAGDAVRVVTTGVLNPPSCWMLAYTGTALVGGSISGTTGNAGNCLHQIGTGSALAPEYCGSHRFAPGSGGALHGGVFAINNDGGVVTGGSRFIPGCVIDTTGFTTAPAVVSTGSTFPSWCRTPTVERHAGSS